MTVQDGRGAWIHGPGMRFIETVVQADAEHLVARIDRLAADHPLAQMGRIGTAILIEYAAQAAAAHAPFCGISARKAYLAAIHAVEWDQDVLTDALLPLNIEVVLEGRTEAAVRYAFTARRAGEVWAGGRLTLAYVGGDA